MVLAVINTVGGGIKDGWGHGWVDGLAIFGAVLLIIGITAGNNYSKEKQFQKLVAKADIDYVAVFRGGNGMT